MNVPAVIIFLGAVVLLAHLFNNLFDRIRVPAVFVLIVTGIIIGPATGMVSGEDFGKVGPVFSNLVLLFILFDSGTKLPLESLRKSISGASVLTVLMFVATAATVGLICHFILHLDWTASVMTGSILGGTSSAIVIPMLKPLSISEESKTLLLMESALSDVLCLVTGLALIAAMRDGNLEFSAILTGVGKSFLFSILLGLLLGLAWSFVINRIRRFQNSVFITGAFVLIAFGVTEYLELNGGIAVLILGITLGNIKTFSGWIPQRLKLHPEPISKVEKKFFGEVVFVFAAYYFVFIGVSMHFSSGMLYLIGGVTTALVFLIRFGIVRLFKSEAIAPYRNVIASLMPKGLVPAILASQPLQMGLPGGEDIQNITFAIILCSIVFSSVLLIFFSSQSAEIKPTENPENFVP